MKKKSPITRERMIEIIEAKLQDPSLPLREFTSLTKRLANLKGWVRQGEYRRVPQSEQQQELQPQQLESSRGIKPLRARWFENGHVNVLIAERGRPTAWTAAINAIIARFTPEEKLSPFKTPVEWDEWFRQHPDLECLRADKSGP